MPRPIPAPRRTPVWLTSLRYVIVALVVIGFLFGYQLVKLYTDWQWFGELGRRDVFRTVLVAKLTLFFGFGVLFFLIAYLNLWVAQRLNASRPSLMLLDPDREQIRTVARRAMGWLTLAGSVIVAFLVAGNAATHWPDYVLYTHAGTFGRPDPVFGNDVGFYVFRIPFLGFLQGWFLFALIVTGVAVAAVYSTEGGAEFMAGARARLPEYVRRHVMVLLALIAFVYAWGIWLGRYDLLYSDNGAFFGAGYTDIHARLPAANIQVVLMCVVGLLCLANTAWGKAFIMPLWGLGAWVVVSIVVAGIWPGLMQKFTVTPNQFGKEQRYIARDIEMTRFAYGIDHVKEQSIPGTRALGAADLAANRGTIGNIRLWDWPELGSVYSAKQALATYYTFSLPAGAFTNGSEYNIDVDRYHLGSEYRQVMLGARELNPDGLPPQANTWQNRRLQYTHGYGLVMSPVNRVDADGLPEYFLSQIPVESSRPELKVDLPQIYYGERTSDYVFVDTAQSEFDYTGPTGNQTTKYTGRGGVPLNGSLARLAWSMRLGDANMLFSSDLTDKSRILFRRSIRERVQQLAPFLNWDNDPYLVLDGGRLQWIMDAYTVSDRFPYSKPTEVGTGMEDVDQSFSYIRNSVKAVVDAYDGTVTLYVADPADPILQTWGRVFPGLLTPMNRMPRTLQQHVRYPEDLFRIQRDIYTVYHITDPGTYYRKEDQWSVPRDPTADVDNQGVGTSSGPSMMPYYVVMRPPGEDSEQFLMITPFTPLSTQNTAGWMCAQCDPEHYGQLLVYRFPRGSNVNGPAQIMSQIKSHPAVSQFQTLMGQQGSRVIYGNLLVIPIQSSLLYALPVYVQATGGQAIPEIQRVIAATGDRIVMETTLDAAIAGLAQGGAMAAAPTPGTTTSAPVAAPGGALGTPPGPVAGASSVPAAAGPASVSQLVQRANDAYARARQKQQEYNRSLDDLGRALQELQRGTAGQRR